MIELIKDYIKITKVILVPPSRSVYEHDCIVPDTLPDMLKVLVADGVVTVDRVSVIKDTVTVDFSVSYRILYLADNAEASIKSFLTTAKHSATFDAPDADANTKCRVDCILEHTEHTFINSRKLSFRSVVKIEPELNSTVEKGITTDLDGLNDIQTRRNTFKISSLCESQTANLNIAETLDIPSGKAAILDLLRADAKLTDVNFTVDDEKVQVKGCLNICALYVSDDNNQSTQIMEHQIPFTQNIQIENGGEYNVRTVLASFRSDVGEDSDGEKRIITIEAIINFELSGYAIKECDILTDAYSLTKEFKLESENLDTTLKVGEMNNSFVIKEVMTKSEEDPDISEVINVNGTIGQADVNIEAGVITVEGFVFCNVLYLSDNANAPIASFTQQVPFTQTFDRTFEVEEPDVKAKLDVSHASYSILSGQELELRIAVSVKLEVSCINHLSTVENVIMLENPDKDFTNRPSILLYVVQPGDSLWKVAKKYSAPISILQNINDIKNPDVLRSGQKLLIPT